MRVVYVAFLERDLAPDHLVAGGSVALELDPSHVKRLAFVHVNIEIDQLLIVVKPGVWNGSEVDVAQLAVGFPKVLQALGDFLLAEDISVFDGKQGSQRPHVLHRLVVLERDSTQRVALALVDDHRDVDRLALPSLQQRDVGAGVSGIVNFGLGLAHNVLLEIATILVFIADSFRIFVQLGGVVGPGKDVFQEDRVRYSDGPQVLHGVTHHPRPDVLIAFKLDLADLDLRTFLHHKRDPDRSRRNLPYFRADGGELPPVFGQQSFDRHFRFLHFRGVVLTFYR